MDSRYAIGSSSNEFVQLCHEMREMRFRPLSLDANGDPSSALFSSVWIRDGTTNWEAVIGLSAEEYTAKVTELSHSGYRVVTVDTCGAFPAERYAATWLRDGTSNSVQRIRMSEPEYASEFRKQARAGFRPSWISASGSGTNLLFAAVWNKDGKPSTARHNLSHTELELACEGREEDGYRPVSISAYGTDDEPRFAAAWVMEEQPEWKIFLDQTTNVFAPSAESLVNAGFRPEMIVASGGTPRYASIWVKDPAQRVLRITGESSDDLAPFDAVVTNLMQRRNIERASLAVTRNSKLLLARSYTWSAEETRPTDPTNLFRIASVSKPITAAAILKLVEAKKISLDQRIAEILDLNDVTDSRWNLITIRQLLQHRGGWNRNASFDPMFRDVKISKSLRKSLPTSPEIVIEYMKGQPLDFDPGSAYAYSNFGYLLLGRIIEKISGKPYEAFVKSTVLEPIGIRTMTVGYSLIKDAIPGEVNYEDPLRRLVPTVMGASSPRRVPLQYGGWNLHTMDAHGGWIGSAVDLVRFASAFDAPAKSPLLSEEWINATWARPEAEKTNSTFYGLGWQMRITDAAGHFNAWHNGSLDGTSTLLVRRFDGLNWAVLLNKRSELPGVPDFLNEFDRGIHKAANSVTNWPTRDLFLKREAE